MKVFLQEAGRVVRPGFDDQGLVEHTWEEKKKYGRATLKSSAFRQDTINCKQMNTNVLSAFSENNKIQRDILRNKLSLPFSNCEYRPRRFVY